MEWDHSPCCSRTYRRQGRRSPGRRSSWDLELRDCGAIPGRRLLLTVERWIQGMWGRRLWRKARQPWKQDDTAESHVGGGAITIAPLPTGQQPQLNNREAGPPNAWCTELEEDPSQGAPSMCLTRWTTEKNPRQGSPLSDWTGGAMERDWPKRPSDHQLQEAKKKDSERAITPAVEAGRVPAHLAPPGSPWPKQLCHLHAQLSLGQSCHRQKMSCVYASMCTKSLWSCPTLYYPVDCGLPGFSVREEVPQARILERVG